MIPSYAVITSKTKLIETFAGRLRSNLERSAARSIARAEAVKRLDLSASRTVRLPRRDDEIAKAWLLRLARRRGIVTVDEVEWRYEADWSGPGAWQFVKVRAIQPDDDEERRLLARLKIPSTWHTIELPVMPEITAADWP